MRHLGSVVRVLRRVVLHRSHHAPASRTVALQLVRHQLPRRALLALEQLAEEPFGRAGVAISLNQDVDHVALLVDGPPQVVSLTPDLHEDLVHVPNVAKSTLVAPQLPGVFGSEVPTPLPVSY